MNFKSRLIGSMIVLASVVGYSICGALQQEDRGVDVVVAAEDLQIGTRLEEGVLRIIKVPSSLAPVGIYNSSSQVIGRIVSLPLIKDEVLFPGKLAPEDPSMFRHFPPSIVVVAIPTVSVRANKVVVADDGSVTRKTTADVLLSKDSSGLRDPQADKIWWGLFVLAVTSRVERSDKGDTQLRPVVTFLINTARDQAEYGHALSLAGAQHRVWVALREPPDTRTFCRSDATPLNGNVQGPILASHRKFRGCCEDDSATDLHVFADGVVAYTEDSDSYNERAGKMLRNQLSCASQLDSDEMRSLLGILDSPGVQALPKEVLLYPEARPIDSSSESSFEISRSDRTQEIHVALSPFTGLSPISKPDPQALTQLECEIEEITAKTVKSSVEPEGQVRSECYEILAQHFRPIMVGSNQAMKLLSSGRYELQSVALDGVGRPWFVLMEREEAAVSGTKDPHTLELLLQHAEFNERLKSDFGER